MKWAETVPETVKNQKHGRKTNLIENKIHKYKIGFMKNLDSYNLFQSIFWSKKKIDSATLGWTWNPKVYVSFASEIPITKNCEQVEQELVNSAPDGEILRNFEPEISVILLLLPLYPVIPILVVWCL